MIALTYEVFKNGKHAKRITTLCRDKECANKHKKAIMKNHERNLKEYSISEIKENIIDTDVLKLRAKIKSVIIEECI